MVLTNVNCSNTQHFDRADKLDAYRRLLGLQHILLLSSREQVAWAISRVPAELTWTDLSPWHRDTPPAKVGLALQLHSAGIYDDGVGL